MALSLATVGGKITAAFLNLLVGRVNRLGLTSIIPTSVTGTGTSVTSNGLITLTGAQTFTINGAFTTEFDNYRIELRLLWSGSAYYGYQLAKSGTADTSASYSYQRTNSIGTASSATNAVNGTIWAGLATGPLVNQRISLEIFGPSLAVATMISGVLGEFTATGATGGMCNYEGFQSALTAYDGLTFTPTNAIAVTGTIRIYGYNNN